MTMRLQTSRKTIEFLNFQSIELLGHVIKYIPEFKILFWSSQRLRMGSTIFCVWKQYSFLADLDCPNCRPEQLVQQLVWTIVEVWSRKIYLKTIKHFNLIYCEWIIQNFFIYRLAITCLYTVSLHLGRLNFCVLGLTRTYV